jgi:Zn-dependent protease
METSFFEVLLVGIISLFSIIIHEVAHGLVAYWFKDTTAQRAGRLTLNPLPHIDIVGSLLIPIASYIFSGTLFGWAKPVPVQTQNLQGKYAEFWVSSAGVLANLAIALLALIGTTLFSNISFLSHSVATMMYIIVIVNFSLFLFNLIPVPPFDGMAILQSLFPRLRIHSRLIHNPLYMIVAIVIASSIYSHVAPIVFKVLFSGL